LSLRELEIKIGKVVTHASIQKYEKDETMPGSSVLRALAQALGVTDRYLLNPGRIDITGIQFREGIEGTERELGATKARVLGAIEKYLDIEELIPGGETEWSNPSGFPYPITKIEDAELAASRLRERWNLGTRAISDLPEVLEERGIKVILVDLDPKVAGILCQVSRGNRPVLPVIAVNAEVPGERQRFGLAQQLAHLLLDFGAIKEDIESVCERFARALLMVHEVFIAAIGKARKFIPVGELFRLKAMFGVAVVQIVNRCMDLGVIGKDERRRLFELFAQAGWTKHPFEEPNPIRRQTPLRFERLCLRAFAEELVSESRVAELLGVPTVELGKYLDQAPGVSA
jgi:Zn-dependent peptidase ImmA (M78 family)